MPETLRDDLGRQHIEQVAELLLANFRRQVLIGRELGVDVWVVGEAVKSCASAALSSWPTRAFPGYTLTGWRRPPRETA